MRKEGKQNMEENTGKQEVVKGIGWMDGRTDGWMGAERGEADGKEGDTLPAG